MEPLARRWQRLRRRCVECARLRQCRYARPLLRLRRSARESSALVVVEDVGDLWALERSPVTRGRYHVLGGRLSALDGVGPKDLRIAGLV